MTSYSTMYRRIFTISKVERNGTEKTRPLLRACACLLRRRGVRPPGRPCHLIKALPLLHRPSSPHLLWCQLTRIISRITQLAGGWLPACLPP